MGKRRAQGQNSNSIVDSIPNIESFSCQHITKSVDVHSVIKVVNKEFPFLHCAKCNNPLDDCLLNICLKCGTFACAPHIVDHINKPRSDSHHIVLQLDNIWTVRCYKCKKDIVPDSNRRVKNCLTTLKNLYNKNQSKSLLVKRRTNTPVNEIVKKMSTDFTNLKLNYKTVNADSISTLPPVRGLSNLGNTCFFNSVLQCLAQTPFLLEVLMVLSEPGEKVKINIDGEHQLTAELDKWGMLTETLANTLQEMTNGSSNCYSPASLLEALRRKCRQFIGYNQHDSHELLRQLLDNVRTEDIKRYQYHILDYYGISKKTSADEVEEKKRTLVKQLNQRLTELVTIRPDQVFKGTLVSTVQCMKCKHTSEVVESFLDLSLPVLFEKSQPSSSKSKLDFFNKDGPSKWKYSKKGKRLAERDIKRKLQVNSIPNCDTNAVSNKYGPNNNVREYNGLDEKFNRDRLDREKNEDSDEQIKLETTLNELKSNTEESFFGNINHRKRNLPVTVNNNNNNDEERMVVENGLDNAQDGDAITFYDGAERNEPNDQKAVTLSDAYVPDTVPLLSSSGNTSSCKSSSSTINNCRDNNETQIRSSLLFDDSSYSALLWDDEPTAVVYDPTTTTTNDKPNIARHYCNSSNDNDNNNNNIDIDNNSSCSSTEATAGGGGAADNSEIEDAEDVQGVRDGDSSDANEDENDDENVNNEEDDDIDNYLSIGEQNLITLAPRAGFSAIESSIHACLSQFTEVEILSKNNKVICEACTDRQNKDLPSTEKKKPVYQPGTKRLLINSPPPVLILHLKRFQGSMFAAFRKISDHVSFPLNLDIAQYCSVKCQNLKLPSQKKIIYSLYGVVEHSGGLYGGHYVAYVKVRPPVSKDNYRRSFLLGANATNRPVSSEEIENELQNDGSWYYISDSNVRLTTVDNVLKSQAYLLFYERIV